MRFRTSSPRRGGEIAGLRLSLLLVAAAALAAPAHAASIGGPVPPPWPILPPSNWWNLDVSTAPVDPASTAFVNWIGAVPLHPDFGGNNGAVAVYGMPYSTVSSGQAKKAVNFQYWDESDGVDDATTKGIPFYPIPDEAITQSHWIEGGQAGNATVGGDRHMLILDTDSRILYELYRLKWDAANTRWIGGSGAAWDLTKNGRRPKTWTSADAAGLAIFPGLVRYEEVYGPGEIGHGFRLTLNDSNGYVYPASHVAGSNASAPPMGARMRLKASKDISGFDPAMQKIFRAMKKYGLILADNGTDMYIGGTYDTRWDNDVLNPAFAALTASDFEFVRLGYMPQVPVRLAVDATTDGTTSSDGNGVLEPGETVRVEPTWTYQGYAAATLTGALSSFTGPAGASYVVDDAAASYGTVPAVVTGDGATVDCSATGNCYRVQVSNPAVRPAAHWDAMLRETLSTSGIRTWTLHVGDSFSDVPRSHPFYAKIETLLHNGVTSGCSTGTFCPEDAVARSQMAIFVANAMARGGATIPVSGSANGHAYNCAAGGVSLFTDVAPTDMYCKHAHALAAWNVTLGCSPTAFCPSGTVSRLEMAGFMAKAVVAPGGGAAVPTTYGPDPVTGRSYSCDGASPNLHFSDVAASDPFCRHAHYLWARGMIAGCSPTAYCPSPDVKRSEMAKFLSNALRLELYRP